jgi:hypothetical protein
MYRFAMVMAVLAIGSFSSLPAATWQIRGQYLEARTCDVFTGPCFANGEMGMAGKEAVVGWKVSDGSWNGVPLSGMTVALVVKADNSLGYDGVFPMAAEKIGSVIVVDEKASEAQRNALVDFVRDSAPALTGDVRKIQAAPMTLEANDDTAVAKLKAGNVAEISTRALGKNDCVCTNETAFYQPLVEVKYPMPAYAASQSYSGSDLNATWALNGSRSAYLGMFRK